MTTEEPKRRGFWKGLRNLLLIVGGFCVSIIATSALGPVEGRLSFVQIPSCYAINTWDNIAHGTKLNDAVRTTIRLQGQVNEFYEDRENARASSEDNQNDVRIINSILNDNRQRCIEREGCDPSRYDADYAVDSYWMSQRLTLNQAEARVERSRERFNQAVTQRREFSAETADARSRARERLAAFPQNSEYCKKYLGSASLRHAQDLIKRGRSYP
ncbi:MAG: hypothetical protein ABJ251_04895 [Paracoccaceae bacterium]